MNSKQPFGTRDFAHGRWGQCGDQSLKEALDQLIKIHGRKKIVAILDEKQKKTPMLSKNRTNMPVNRKRFEQILDVFEPMFQLKEDSEKARHRMWMKDGMEMTYADVLITMSQRLVDTYINRRTDKTIN